MSAAIVGYARTSSADQLAGLADQIAELEGAGATKVFSEQVSGVDAGRPQLKAALDYCREGDIFTVTKPDRLARSTPDLLRIVTDLQARGVRVRIMSMGGDGGALDTSTPTGMFMLTVLAGVSQFERALMLERQRAGIAAAKAAGRYKGRAPTAQRKAAEVKAMKASGADVGEIVKRTGVSRASVYRLLANAD